MWTYGPSQASESTHTETRGSRRAFLALARSGYVAITSRPSESTPHVTGELTGRPSRRL